MKPINKTHVKVIFAVLAIFVLGIITGALGAGLYLKHQLQEFAGRPPEERDTLFMRRLTRELDLTDAQKPQIQAIVQETMQGIRQMMETSRQEFDALMKQRTVELKKVLTPAQQQQLDAMLTNMRTRWPGPPPPPREANHPHRGRRLADGSEPPER